MDQLTKIFKAAKKVVVLKKKPDCFYCSALAIDIERLIDEIVESLWHYVIRVLNSSQIDAS